MNRTELHLQYKQETGQSYDFPEDALETLKGKIKHQWRALTIEEYILWLENKLLELLP